MSSQSEVEARRNLRRKADLFREVFGSPHGQRVLHMLKEEYDPDILFTEDPRLTDFKLGGRDVIKYIESILEFDRVEE